MERLSLFTFGLLATLVVCACAKTPNPDLAVTNPSVSPADQAAPAASAPTAPMSFDAMPPVGTKAFCPVMKREFTVAADSTKSEHNGKVYVFCCTGCKPQFDADPAKYL